jgi:hypothetical protein
VVQSQSGQIVLGNSISKNPSQNRAGRVAQGEGPEFKPQQHQKKKRKKREKCGSEMIFFKIRTRIVVTI